MRQRWAGLGGGGLKLSYEIIRMLHNNRYLVDIGQTNNGDSLPPSPGTQMTEKDSDDQFGPYLQSPDSDVELSYYGIDTDSEIIGTLREINPENYKELLKPNLNYFTIIKELGGSGTGAVPERINNITEETPAIKGWLKSVTGKRTGIFVPIFSLDGGSGFGFCKEHMDLIDQREIYNSGNTKIMPMTISPHRSDANRRCVWREGDIERTAKENTMIATDYIEKRLRGNSTGLIDMCILVDNDFAAYNALCNREKQDYDSVTEKRISIYRDGDYSHFYKDLPKLDYSLANQGIKNSIFPIVMMLLRGPTGINFGKITMDGYDHQDLSSFFNSYYIVPSHLDITFRQETEDIFREYHIPDRADQLAFLSFYTFSLSCAPFNADNVENIKIFIWTEDEEGITEDIRYKVKEKMAELGVEQISVEPVVGLNNSDSVAKIWTLTGVSAVNKDLKGKFRTYA